MIDFIKPSECRFTSDDILWILNNCLEGWPTKESGYNDAPLSKAVNPHMPKETELLVIAEIKVRLALCGDSGRKFLAVFIGANRLRDIQREDLTPEWRSVLSYVSGQCRRCMPCDHCLVKNCKRRGRKPCTFNQWRNHNR